MYFLLQEIQELREQLRDVMFFMEAQQKLSETSEVSQTELQQSQVIVGGGASGTSPSPRSKKGRKKDRWERQDLYTEMCLWKMYTIINMWMMHLHVHTLIITRCMLMMYTLYYMLFMYASNKHLDTLCPIPLHNPEIYRLTGIIQDVPLSH